LPVVFAPCVSEISAPVTLSKSASLVNRRFGASDRALLFWSEL
jgi:hypothetical protein